MHTGSYEMAEADFLDAKAYLLKASDASGTNVYDHLSSVISKMLDERPNNAVDLLESISAQVKKEQFVDRSNTIQVYWRKNQSQSIALCHHHTRTSRT